MQQQTARVNFFSKMNHPIQPLVKDGAGVLRFLANNIVQDLYDLHAKHGLDMNTIAQRDYPKEDRQQFAQLIGYSLSGYAELTSYVDNEAYFAAVEKSKGSNKSDDRMRADHLRKQLAYIKRALRKPIAALYEMHPDDLKI